MTKTKINTALRDKLFSSDSTTVISAIQSLKQSGNKAYLPILFELLIAKPEDEIQSEILKLLGTVKDNETIPVFIEALQNSKYLSIRKEITMACWQNGMDFSPYFEVFTDIIINEQWETAFEAFTVIENFEHFPSLEELKPIKLKIAGALKNAGEQKQYFLEEILRMT